MSTLGQRIAAARERQGLTQQEVAQRVKLPQQAISRLEREGRTHVRSDVLARLAVALDVSADYLLGLDAPGQATSQDSDTATGKQKPAPARRMAKRAWA